MNIQITGVRLRRHGQDVLVMLEVAGNWVPIIVEPFDANFDTIVNDIFSKLPESAQEQLYIVKEAGEIKNQAGYTAPGPPNFERKYHNNGAILEWGRPLTDDVKRRLEDGEIFTLLDAKGNPIKGLCLDYYNQLRERKI
jgi:hypothetical protein